MRTVSIMQPYFFPYIGYFQLIEQADTFVLYDDVQFIKNGWSNRNRILRLGEPALLTFPVESSSHQSTYSERRYRGPLKVRNGILDAIRQAYRRAPQFKTVMPLIEQIMFYPETSVATFNRNLIQSICDHIGVETKIVASSELRETSHLSGQDRVIAICQGLGANRYLNPYGGVALYDGDAFERAGVELMFNAPEPIEYDQFDNEPVRDLSIIDVMMFNEPPAVREMCWRSSYVRPVALAAVSG